MGDDKHRDEPTTSENIMPQSLYATTVPLKLESEIIRNGWPKSTSSVEVCVVEFKDKCCRHL